MSAAGMSAQMERQAGLVLPFRGVLPAVANDVFIAPNATLIGNVTVGRASGVWYGAVLRGDVAPIVIGEETNIQDGSVVHVSRDKPQGTIIGNRVTVGHLALIHACTLEDGCLVGMRACVMDGAVVETGGWVAAGAVVTPGKRIKRGQLWAGTPARHLRDLSPEEIASIEAIASLYVGNRRDHIESLAGEFGAVSASLTAKPD